MTGIMEAEFHADDETTILREFFEEIARDAGRIHTCPVCNAPDEERMSELVQLVEETGTKLQRVKEMEGTPDGT